MKTLIRYFSKSGRTRKIAETLAEELKLTAESIDNEDASKVNADVMFLGGAPYANVMDPKLESYARKLQKNNIKLIILFTTSNWSLRTIKGLRKILTQNGITVADEYFNANAFKMEKGIKEARKFASKIAEKYIK